MRNRILRFPLTMVEGLLQALQSLQTAINGKADAAHGHAITDVDGLETTLISKVAQSREITAGTGLSGGGDLSADRTLSVSFGTTEGTACAGNDSRLSDSRAPTAHTHELGDVTGLQAGLSAKEDAGTAAELLDGHTDAADPHPQYAMGSTLETALSTKADLIDGVLPTSQLPALAIVEFLGAIESEEEMLELIGQRGDWCIRTDLERAFFLTGDDAEVVDNWQQITTPGSPVLTVNDQTGDIVLGYADVGAAAASHSHDIADVTGLQSALDAKPPTSRKVQAGTGLSGGGDLTADRTLSVQYGTASGTACQGNDSRLSNSRTPTSHAASHVSGGTDPVTLAQSQVTNLTTDLNAKAPANNPTFTTRMSLVVENLFTGFWSYLASDTAAHALWHLFYRSGGTTASRTATPNGANMGVFGWRGHNGTDFAGNDNARYQVVATEAHSSTAAGCRVVISSTPTGSTTLTEGIRIIGATVGVGLAADPTATIDVGGNGRVRGCLSLDAMTDAAALNNSLFRGSDHSNKLCWKDNSGTVRELY